MKAYLAIFRGRFSTLFQYRIAAFAGLSTQVFWGIVKVMILTAFYEHSSSMQPISLAQSITFIWLGQTLLQLLPWNVDKELEGLVKTGNVSYELVRPLDLYGLWFFRSFAVRLIPTLLRGIPLFMIASLIFGLSQPVSFSAGVLFALSLIFAALLSASMTTLFLITLFWTISGEGILRLIPHVTMLLTGLVVPLPLYPAWMQPFISLQPFRGIVDIPIRFYTGIIPAYDAVYYLGFQALWLSFFLLLGRWLMNKALWRLVIQGG